VLWIDDRQVVRLIVEKVRGAQGEPPRVEVTVKPAAALV
jgi:Holliday junction resolvase RusA-like endonuclease